MEKSKVLLNWGSKLTAMKNAILLLGVFLVTTTHMAIGQELNSTSSADQQENEIKKRWDGAVGSFQFEVSNERSEARTFQIDMTVIDRILESRDDKDIVYLEYNDFIRIKVLPFDMINGNYEKLEVIKKVENFENQ